MERYQIINKIIQSKGFNDYLEIGVRDGQCFKQIVCKNKTGVDPFPTSEDTTHRISSDEFFEECDKEKKFDIIFIDGLHLEEQVDKDINNSLDFLKEGGVIVLHDCNPPTLYHASETPVFTPPANGNWNGTVYRSLIKLRLYRKDLKLKTVDSDWGVGILTRGESNTLNAFPDEAMTWEWFSSNRKEVLNLISPEEFSMEYV
jgi:hypothetical protein